MKTLLTIGTAGVFNNEMKKRKSTGNKMALILITIFNRIVHLWYKGFMINKLLTKLQKEETKIATVNHRQQAENVLERTSYKESEEEIQKLEQQMDLLSQFGLNNLNEILINNARGSARNLSDFIAEHNFGAELIRFDSDNPPLYEPPGYNRPPDFVVLKQGKRFFLQMKKLSESERDNRRNKLIERVKRNLQDIPIGKFINIAFSEEFDASELESFISFINESINNIPHNLKIAYPSESEKRAVFEISPPTNIQLQHLTVSLTGDMEWLGLTDQAENQVRNSLTKAIGAFEWDNDEYDINLIVMEADHYDDIDISQAVFGTEIFSRLLDGSFRPKRDSNGFFYDPNYDYKICGVIALRRTDRSLISRYNKTLFINDRYSHMNETVKKVIGIDKVFTYCDIPSSE